ncbi:MAG: pyrimidine dimer DNA glycosylase/endonuclease V [Candidatus Pacearchaeota archaeon]
MQTFLPYPDIEKSVRCLDSRRLGKQRIEAYQILNILLKRTKSNAWKNHPTVKMWEGYENALKLYLNMCIKEWIRRGYRNNMKLEEIKGRVLFPKWFGNEEFHSSHRSNLLRKDKKYYSKFGWEEEDNLPYTWPVSKDKQKL